jgi:hypothetical protein
MRPDEQASFEQTLELGKALAKDLDDRDLLGRWMAHHVSALITQAKEAAGPDSNALRQEAQDAILALWNHRANAPLRSRPTYNLDVVIRALERLETPQDWLFYNTFRSGEEPDEESMANVPSLRLALDIEASTKEVVIHVLRLAADEADAREAPWIEATNHLIADNQRSIWNFLRQVDRRHRWKQLVEESDGDDEPTVEGSSDEPIDADQPDRILSALKGIQHRLDIIRSTIEHRLNDDSTS